MMWFKNCLTRHPSSSAMFTKLENGLTSLPGCTLPNPRELPKRIVDMQSTDNPEGDAKPVETQGKIGRYVYLSHCLGDYTPTTTSKNFAQHQKIKYSAISKDAITSLREFSKRYEGEFRESLPCIWFDSLCIIQDSIDDCKEHAQTM